MRLAIRLSAPALLVAGAALVLVGCGRNNPPKAELAPASGPANGAAAAPAAHMPGLDGTVLEAIPAPPYTYLRLKTAEGEVWAGVPEIRLAKGTQVTLVDHIEMRNFESKTLKKTFDRILLGGLASQAGAAASGPATAPAAAPAMGTPIPGANAHMTPTTTGPDEKVAKATGAGAATVQELYGNAALAGKQVTVRGKVVKSASNIMGKNWLHLRDGSGSAQAGDNDITVTTAQEAKVGEVVTVKGALTRNKDFGMGYAYKAIIEDAKITK